MKTRDLNCNLDPRLQLLSDISMLSNKIQTIGNAYGDELSWKQGVLLVLLHSCDYNPTIGQLADMLGTSHQNTKTLLLKLEEKEFINMIRDPNDRRKTIIYGTEKSSNFFDEHEASYEDFLGKLFKDFDEKTMKDALAIVKNMNETLEGYE